MFAQNMEEVFEKRKIIPHANHSTQVNHNFYNNFKIPI